MRTSLLALCALITLGACARSAASTAGPEATIRAFHEANGRGDTAAVYALLDEHTRERVSLEELEAALVVNRAEIDEQMAALAGRTDASETHAELSVVDADPVLLVLEPDGYRLASGVLDVVAPRTPEAAVLALRQALRYESLPALLRILSRRTRAELEAELEELLTLTDDGLDIRVDTDGDRATIRLSEDRALELVREGGEWRIDDLR